MSQAIAVSKANKNVLTETDPNSFIFNSLYNTFKELAKGTLLTQTVNASPKTFSVAHNQNKIPAFYAFAKFPDGKVAAPDNHDYTEQYNVSAGYGVFTVEADSTNLYFIFTKNTGAANYNVDIRYYIYEAPLN